MLCITAEMQIRLFFNFLHYCKKKKTYLTKALGNQTKHCFLILSRAGLRPGEG